MGVAMPPPLFSILNFPAPHAGERARGEGPRRFLYPRAVPKGVLTEGRML